VFYMRAEDADEIGSLSLFDGVDPNQVKALHRGAFLQRFPAHVELAREGEPADFLHVIVSGQVELYAAHHGRETTVSVIGPGHRFVVAAVLLDRIYLQSARAMVPSRILLIPADAVREAFAEDGVFARSLARELAFAFRALVKELKNQKLRSNLERLANWLLVRDRATGGTGRFELPFDKKTLAARLGMAPEVLSRSFAALASCRVAVDGSEITLDDIAALTKLANPCVTIDDASV
jgi:CRP/FNR family transcriptional regulator, transcriptional activator FtrB